MEIGEIIIGGICTIAGLFMVILIFYEIYEFFTEEIDTTL